MFETFKTAVEAQFATMRDLTLYRIDLDRNVLWDTYLKAFPRGSDPVFRERSEHDCQCCRAFLRNAGGMVAIDTDNKVITLWDIQIGGFYQVVADAMAALVRATPIENIFLHPEPIIGVGENVEVSLEGEITWKHFAIDLPRSAYEQEKKIGKRLSDLRGTKDVMLRGLKEITMDSLEVVYDLIVQNTLYRGAEQKRSVEEFMELKSKFDQLDTDEDKDRFCWTQVQRAGSIGKIRNHAVGTLLIDLSAGKDLETAVRAFERMVAPESYKRPTALVSASMINAAKTTIEQLGLMNSLQRRFATDADLDRSNLLYVNEYVRPAATGDLFEGIIQSLPINPKTLDRVDEMPIDRFLADIVPHAKSIQVYFESRHTGNLVSLIAPEDASAPTLFQWPNGYSWSYRGDVTDSIRERVKEAGGQVVGDFRASLSWNNSDDEDLHLVEPDGNEIYWHNKSSRNGAGTLDVDMNAAAPFKTNPVENIIFPDKRRMQEGVYTLSVNQFHQRSTENGGFQVELELDGVVHFFEYPEILGHKQKIEIAQIEYNRTTGFKILESRAYQASNQAIWGLSMNAFHDVSKILLSPNYWDGKTIGNKHFLFEISGAKNDATARGFYNEFLSSDLAEHRKALELIGSKIRVPVSDEQVSGLGFSATQRNSILVKVEGSFTRTIKVTF